VSGKKISFAPTDQVESFGVLVSDFMSSIFELEPGEHMITDESDLFDFTPLDSEDTTEIWARIGELYGIASSDVASERSRHLRGNPAEAMSAMTPNNRWRGP
jgi:hypothetical protein